MAATKTKKTTTYDAAKARALRESGVKTLTVQIPDLVNAAARWAGQGIYVEITVTAPGICVMENGEKTQLRYTQFFSVPPGGRRVEMVEDMREFSAAQKKIESEGFWRATMPPLLVAEIFDPTQTTIYRSRATNIANIQHLSSYFSALPAVPTEQQIQQMQQAQQQAQQQQAQPVQAQQQAQPVQAQPAQAQPVQGGI